MPIIIIVDGEAVPKQSYRAVKGGGYTSPRVKAWQEQVAWAARERMRGNPPITGDVTVMIRFMLTNKRRRDLDNLSKGTLDGLRGIVFADDCQVRRLVLEKVVMRDVQPYTRIDVMDYKEIEQ